MSDSEGEELEIVDIENPKHEFSESDNSSDDDDFERSEP